MTYNVFGGTLNPAQLNLPSDFNQRERRSPESKSIGPILFVGLHKSTYYRPSPF